VKLFQAREFRFFRETVIDEEREVNAFVREYGFPIIIKAVAGGGGKGMRIVHNDEELRQGLMNARSEAFNSFGDDRIYLEKFMPEAKAY
jgi:acetyl/propionyl-CoA carboxylase alpha subunit